MAHSIVRILVHIIFSTKNRADLITPKIENDLFGYIHGIVENNNAKLIIAGGMPDHTHLLISLPKKIDVPSLIGDVKRDSSSWIKKQGTEFQNFYWQKGYGVFSIGHSQVGMVTRYIKNQKEHHQKRDFKDEFRLLLKKYEVEYDEKYVWD